MSKSRKLFISYAYTSKKDQSFGFGELETEVDFPINNREDLNLVFAKGLIGTDMRSIHATVLYWRFFEE